MPQQALNDDAEARVVEAHLAQADEERRGGSVVDVAEEGLGERDEGEVLECGGVGSWRRRRCRSQVRGERVGGPPVDAALEG